jgi:hypothetical protein
MSVLGTLLGQAHTMIAAYHDETIESGAAITGPWTTVVDAVFARDKGMFTYNERGKAEVMARTGTLSVPSSSAVLSRGQFIRIAGADVYAVIDGPSGNGQRIYVLDRVEVDRRTPNRGKSE